MVRLMVTLTVLVFSANVLSTQFASMTDGLLPSTASDANKPEVHVISNSHVNRIVTPFVNPSLKMDSVGGVVYKQQDNVIYLSTGKGNRNDIAAFVTEKGDETVAIPVVLKPKAIGPQQIEIGSTHSFSSNAMAQRFERSYPRDQTIERVLNELGKGDLPEGYSLRGVSATYLPKCTQSGLIFDFYRGQLASGGDYVVSIGTVKNSSKSVIEFKENNCGSNDVIAVASYPKTVLKPNQVSEVFVMFYRNKPSVGVKRDRKSLIGG
ncbi:TraK domain-containing protein [Vibrio sp. 10N]|uniref:TraK domain-containing protein n=1 Tax=Vibrio sp. 10N TaxID=3058938 RepID=UPI0028132277|nr:hypothetical protein VB10N_46740 [Vibrio sp. 10N]